MTEQQQTQPEPTTGELRLGDGGEFTQDHVNELLERLVAVEARAEAAEMIAEQATRDIAEAEGEPSRYAAYDTIYERFVGGVHDTKKAAAGQARELGHKAGIKVREV